MIVAFSQQFIPTNAMKCWIAVVRKFLFCQFKSWQEICTSFTTHMRLQSTNTLYKSAKYSVWQRMISHLGYTDKSNLFCSREKMSAVCAVLCLTLFVLEHRTKFQRLCGRSQSYSRIWILQPSYTWRPKTVRETKVRPYGNCRTC